MHRAAQRQRVFCAAFVQNLVAPRRQNRPKKFSKECTADRRPLQRFAKVVAPVVLKVYQFFPDAILGQFRIISHVHLSPESALGTY